MNGCDERAVLIAVRHCARRKPWKSLGPGWDAASLFAKLYGRFSSLNCPAAAAFLHVFLFDGRSHAQCQLQLVHFPEQKYRAKDYLLFMHIQSDIALKDLAENLFTLNEIIRVGLFCLPRRLAFCILLYRLLILSGSFDFLSWIWIPKHWFHADVMCVSLVLDRRFFSRAPNASPFLQYTGRSSMGFTAIKPDKSTYSWKTLVHNEYKQSVHTNRVRCRVNVL